MVQKPSETTSKKARGEELLDYVTAKWFQYTFILMYMVFVSQTADPWEVPVRQAVEVMQKIWDATCDHEYEIMLSTPVFQKVCDTFGFRKILIFIFQTVQRCSDSWQNVVGSTDITGLLAFFDSQDFSRD